MFTPPIIADTNIFVAAGFNRRSSSRRIIDALDEGRLLQVWNDRTRKETLTVVEKIPPLDEDFTDSLFRQQGYYPGPTAPHLFDIIDDESDRKFAALANACGVILITNDSDFLQVRDLLDITVLKPSEFVTGRDI